MMNFDELISNGELTKAARLFANEYYDSGRMGNTRRLLIEMLADKCDKYDSEIARQSVKSEDVQEAIEWMREELVYPEYDQHYHKASSIELAITALQAYQPWVSVSDRLPTKDDADKKGLVLTYDKLETQETFPWDCIEEWNATKDNKITHWKPLPEPPKGGLSDEY